MGLTWFLEVWKVERKELQVIAVSQAHLCPISYQKWARLTDVTQQQQTDIWDHTDVTETLPQLS